MAIGETKIIGAGGAIGLTLGTSVVVCTAFLSGFVNGCKSLANNVEKPEILCSTMKPIEWSTRDTRETAEQVVIHNAKWRAFCEPLDEGVSDGKKS